MKFLTIVCSAHTLRYLTVLLAVTSPATLALAPLGARAADAPTSALEEIVVTARKRTEGLQDVPVSITAFTADSLERIGAAGLQDILFRTPNLYQAYLGEAKGSPPIIRGITGTNTAGADPAVGFVVDDVYYGNNTAAVFDFFDIESLEVLRGPQGTLFGRNTTGGVINVRTGDPSSKPSGELGVTYGNYDYVRVQGLLTGPVIDERVAAKIAVVYNDRDGFIENTHPDGQDLRNEHNWLVRTGLKITPRESTEIDLRLDYRDVDQRGGGYKADGDLAFFTGVIPGTEHLLYQSGPPFEYSVNWDQSGRETLKAWGASLTAVQQFSGSELRSITAYRTHDYFSIFDTDLSPNQWINDGSPEEFRQVSQELRWSSGDTGNGSWIAGLYYYHGNSLDQNFITFQQDILGLLGAPPGTPDLKSQADGRQVADSFALYGHVDRRISERAALAFGLRVTHDRKEIDYAQEDPSGFFGGGFTLQDSDEWTAPTGTLTLSYRWTPDSLSYISIARGYKAGGFNDGIGQADNPPFDPEYVNNYELGWKAAWLDNRVRFNASAYYLDWKDIQIAGFDTSDPNNVRRVTGNFGRAHSKGVELELTARPIEAFEFGLSGALLRGKLEADPARGIAGTDSLTGPEYSLSASVLFDRTLPSVGRLQWYVDAQRQGPNDLIKSEPAPGQIVGPHQTAFNVVNARLSLESLDARWSVALWGKNLTDEVYRSKYFQIGTPLLPPGALVLSEPRTYGVDVRLGF